MMNKFFSQSFRSRFENHADFPYWPYNNISFLPESLAARILRAKLDNSKVSVQRRFIFRKLKKTNIIGYLAFMRFIRHRVTM